jgi:hypothetical protein
LIKSGLKESQESRLILTDDWTPSVLDRFIQYIYLNEVDQFASFEDCTWVINNAVLYGMVDTDHRPTREFGLLINHCRRTTSLPPTLSNCIEMYQTSILVGTELRKKQCRDFVVKNFINIMNDAKLAAQLCALDEKLVVQIALNHFGHQTTPSLGK